MSPRLPIPSRDAGLSAYLAAIQKHPILTPEEEYMLAERWRAPGDAEAAKRLITSHLRLVAKIALGYRGYGLPLEDVIAEGNIGLMKAVKRFEPERGFRLSTYAMWWIRASIQEYILRSWSLVKLGTTAAQKKLFFNLRRLKGQIKALEEGDLSPEAVKEIADRLDVPEQEVVNMNRRLTGPDQSLNTQSQAESGVEWLDRLVSDAPDQEAVLAEADETEKRRELLQKALDDLNDRERRIFIERCLKEPPTTLEELSQIYGISRERVRQIEVRAFEKLQTRTLELAITAGMIDHAKAAEARASKKPRRGAAKTP